MSIHPEGDDIDEIISISVLDYLQKANLEETAQTFFGETMKEYYDPPIDSPSPFLLTWWETHWSTLIFGKQVHESNILQNAPPFRPGVFDRNGSAVVPPFKFAPSLVMNNMFLQNYFNAFASPVADREKKGFTSFNPLVVPPPVYPPDHRFNMSMMFPHIGPQQNQQTPATQPEEGHGRNELLSNDDNSNEEGDFGLNDDGLHLGNSDKMTPPMYARAIVKNGKNCFERIKNQRKAAIKAEAQQSLPNFDHRKLMHEPRLKNSKSRASQYRGVSRNGNQWQAIIMVHNKKRYIGSYSYETDAAKSYDKAALQYHGEKAKTNFTYAADEIEQIRREEPIISLQL